MTTTHDDEVRPGGSVICRPGPDDDVASALKSAERDGASVFVLVSSARVYGTSPAHDMMLDETSPLADRFADARVGALAAADQLCCDAIGGRRAMRIVVLRPVHVLGPRTDSTLTRFLRSPRVRGAFGFDPMLQVIHEDDVALAVKLAVDNDVTGPYNVAGPGGLPLSVLVRETGGSRITGPTGVLVDSAERLGITLAARLPPDELRYVLSVDDARFRRDVGYVPRHSLRETVDSVMGA